LVGANRPLPGDADEDRRYGHIPRTIPAIAVGSRVKDGTPERLRGKII